ncbi:extracellular matrix protein FRAS1-like, partial [Stegodyphus dumicola]|uniref:extracellular matrix protein FRAS1-like n=1 Tax=Stegodyphus dumicola TaxID=202533 RepID=UPI0015A8B16F
DKNNPDATDTEFQGIPFNARFIDDLPEFSSLATIPGVDGFIFKVDPLYEISSSQQWFLQVIYSIKPIYGFRRQRSLESIKFYMEEEQNGTNMKMISLQALVAETATTSEEIKNLQATFGTHHILYIISVLLIIVGLIIIKSKSSYTELFKFSKASDALYTWIGFFDTPPSSQLPSNMLYQVQCKQKVKQKQICRVKVYSPKNEISFPQSSESGTEV